METAIKKAIEGGYKNWHTPLTVKGILDNWPKEYIVLDLQFWQSLGKAMGWEYPVEETINADTDNPITVRKTYTWKQNWHRFIDSLAEGQSPEEFFKNLLGGTGL